MKMEVRVTERFKDGSKNNVQGSFIKDDGTTIRIGTSDGVRDVPLARLSSIRFVPLRQQHFRPH